MIKFREQGVWRDETLIHDLARWRAERPDGLAIIARQVDEGVTTRLTYREYAQRVEQFAGALRELGVGPGDVVALQLPNVWQLPVLLLAGFHVGATVAPIMPSIRSRELERMLQRVEPSVFVTDTEAFESSPYSLALEDTSADPDRVSLVMFTSGTTGEPKAALHTLNTWGAYQVYAAGVTPSTPDNRTYMPHTLTHAGAIGTLLIRPVLDGTCALLTDVWAPGPVARFLSEVDVTGVVAAPFFLTGLVAEAPKLPNLRYVTATGTPAPAQLITDVRAVLGVRLGTAWAMTEAAGTFIRPDDPDDWIRHSVGRPIDGDELDIRDGRLFIRGAGVCLATLSRDSGELSVIDDWYDTGDLAEWDGRGGIKIVGRIAERIGGPGMIPVADVESALLEHPGVEEVAMVGYPDGSGGQLPAAFVVAADPAPTLAELRDHLAALGMTEWYWPSRLELVAALPRNALGKVRKDALARELDIHAAAAPVMDGQIPG